MREIIEGMLITDERAPLTEKSEYWEYMLREAPDTPELDYSRGGNYNE